MYYIATWTLWVGVSPAEWVTTRLPPCVLIKLVAGGVEKLGIYWSGQLGENQGRLYLDQDAVLNELPVNLCLCIFGHDCADDEEKTIMISKFMILKVLSSSSSSSSSASPPFAPRPRPCPRSRHRHHRDHHHLLHHQHIIVEGASTITTTIATTFASSTLPSLHASSESPASLPSLPRPCCLHK